MVKREPIPFDNNCVVVSKTVVGASMSHSNSTERPFEAPYPSETIQALTQTSFMDQLIKTTHIKIEDCSTPMITSTNDELSILPRLVQTVEDTPIIHHHISLKRPRLSYNKRLKANARERERVHNLTAAFEALRKVIPMYNDQSKLSRLSLLRIACSYVHLLGALNEIDFSQGQNGYTLNESFHMLSCTILSELTRKKPN
jgi:hypothetical protein